MKKYSEMTLKSIIALVELVDEMHNRTQDFIDYDKEYWNRFVFECSEEEAEELELLLLKLDTTVGDIVRLAMDIIELFNR